MFNETIGIQVTYFTTGVVPKCSKIQILPIRRYNLKNRGTYIY